MAGVTPIYGLPFMEGTDIVHTIDETNEAQMLALEAALGSRGKSIVATEEARANTAYGLLTTPDRVSGIVLPADGLICVAYQALWKQSVSPNAATAAIFLGANQLQIRNITGTAPGPTATSIGQNPGTANRYVALVSSVVGLASADDGFAATDDVTTGQVLGLLPNSTFPDHGGICTIFAAAGTYDVSVQFKASSGTVTVKNRRLRVWTEVF